MKANKLRELHTDELKEKLSEMEEELFNLHFQAKIGQLSNPVLIRMVKRDIARIKTILNEQKSNTKNPN